MTNRQKIAGTLACLMLGLTLAAAVAYPGYEAAQDNLAIDHARMGLLTAGNLNPAAIEQLRKDMQALRDRGYSRADARRIVTGY